MKKKFKYLLGGVAKHRIHKNLLFIIARYEREHICGVKDIQYLVRDEKYSVYEISEDELIGPKKVKL